jgi:hypothetical protein
MTIHNILPGSPLAQAIIRTAVSKDGGHLNQFLYPVAAEQIALTIILGHRDVWTPRSLKSSLPTIVMISDDDGDSRNPDEWRCAISAIAWARSAIVHGCGAEPWHYREAVKAALQTGRCLFVETDSDHVAAWAAAIAPRGIPSLSIIPRAGLKHPIPAGEALS